MKLKKSIGISILLLLIVLAIGYGFMPRPVIVETAKAKVGPMRVSIDEEGMTRVINRYIISAPVQGYMLRINLKVGDKVRKGQKLAELEPTRSTVLDRRSREEAEARVSSAEARLNSLIEESRAAEAINAYAQKEFERINRLYKEGIASQESVDAADTELQRTEASLRSSRFAIDMARFEKEAASTALKHYTVKDGGSHAEKVLIRAPLDGHVLKINKKSEGSVNIGQPILEIGNPDLLEVEVDVLSNDAVRIRPGTPVIFNRWGGDSSLDGRVRTVEPAGFTKISALGVEEQRVLVISDFTSPHEQWTGLGDRYRIEASFIIWEEDEVLQVPSSALFRYEKEWALFMFSGNRAILRQVEVGHRNGLSAEILSGITEGDTVITHPDNSIKNNTAVRLQQ